MLLCNGYPRTGTNKLHEHAVSLGWRRAKESARDWKTPEGGVWTACHGHVWTDWGGPVWFTIRHPRNTLVSISRAHRNITPEAFLTLRQGWNAPPTFGRLWVDGYRGMAQRWLKRATRVFRYEDYDAPHSVTWTGRPSQWEEHWSDELEAAWQKAGGPELERMLGYGA